MTPSNEANTTLARTERELRLAAIRGDGDVVVHLLERGIAVDATDRYGFTPLMLAAKHGHLSIVSHLLENGAVVGRLNAMGSSALRYAVSHGHEAITIRLLAAGGNVNKCCTDVPLLDFAAGSCADDATTTRILRLLLQHGADLKGADGIDSNALFCACKAGKTAAARELLTAGAGFSDTHAYKVAHRFASLRQNVALVGLLESWDANRQHLL